MIYGRIQQAMANTSGSSCVPGIGHAPDMTKAEAHVWGCFHKPWSTLWGSQTFSHELSLCPGEVQSWSSHPTYLAATSSNLTVTSPWSTFPASGPTVTTRTTWHPHFCAAAWSTCEKGILIVRLWTQAHKDDVTTILGLGTHCSYFLHKTFWNQKVKNKG